MSSHAIALVVYAALVVTGLGLQLRSRSERSRIPSIGTAFRRAMRTRSGRVGLVVGWAWLGLHFMAR